MSSSRSQSPPGARRSSSLPTIRVRGALLSSVYGSHGDDAIDAGGEVDGAIVVPGGRHHEDALGTRGIDGSLHRFAVALAAQAQVDDLDRILAALGEVRCELDALRDVEVRTLAIGVQYLDREDSTAMGESCDTCGVVRGFSDDGGHVGAVAVVVVGVGVVVDEIVAREECRSFEVRRLPVGATVLVGDSGVEDGDGDGAAPLLDAPDPFGIEHLEVPLVLEQGVVGCEGVSAGPSEDAVALDEGHLTHGREPTDSLVDGDPWREAHQVGHAVRGLAGEVASSFTDQGVPEPSIEPVAELDDDFAVSVGGCDEARRATGVSRRRSVAEAVAMGPRAVARERARVPGRIMSRV